MATITLRDDLAAQLQALAHSEHSDLDDLVEELLALYQSMNPHTIAPRAAPDTEAYVGSLGSMCHVGKGDLSTLSNDFRETIIGDSGRADRQNGSSS